ncbi:MAG: transglutaminase domain-containing protein [Candidatus Caenarcaniphilales bacterium]|nr:transglutaminase domain-containing protein [Candidatus Caenarcaniphilales bacterium]
MDNFKTIHVAGVLCIIFVFASILNNFKNLPDDTSPEDNKKAELFRNPIEDRYIKPFNIPKPSKLAEPHSLFVVKNKKLLKKEELLQTLRKNKGLALPIGYSFGDNSTVNLSEPGTDGDHHFTNAYLEDYMPFFTENLWVPLYTISKRKKYLFDHINYPEKIEVWQSSKEAFRNTRGDCEDHAIALADWLISLGEDARVVLGHYKNGGHAWVILFKDNKEFLLEATQKSGLAYLKQYPLAKLRTRYHPKYMFNRKGFWLNEGSVYTTSYSGDNWILKSNYEPEKPLNYT